MATQHIPLNDPVTLLLLACVALTYLCYGLGYFLQLIRSKGFYRAFTQATIWPCEFIVNLLRGE